TNIWPGVINFRTPAASGGTVDHASQRLWINAQFGSERHAFCNGGHGNAQNQVITDFCDLSGSYSATMHQIFAHTAKDRFYGLKGGIVCTHHKGQGTVFGAQSPARDWRITDTNLSGL